MPHTPGPWTVATEHAHSRTSRTIEHGTRPVAYTPGSPNTETDRSLDRTDASNAALIAAAPQLLDALRSVACAFEFYKHNYPTTWIPDNERRLREAHAVIATYLPD